MSMERRALLLLCLLAAAGCQVPLVEPRYQSPDPAPSAAGTSISRPLPSPVSNLPREDDDLFTSAWRRVTSFWRTPPNELKARETFREADELFLAKDFAAARAAYSKAAGLFPDSPLEEDALFMVGECYFFEDRYPKATDAYAALLEKYINSRHLDRVTPRLFAMGNYWQKVQQTSPSYSLTPNLLDKTRPLFDTTGTALTAFQTIWTRDPRGPLADDAVMQTANTHFLDGDWASADNYYSQLRKDYPNSQHIVQAFLLGYRAKLEKYHGPGYDRAPLNEAEELIETLLTQFHDQLGDERERVLQARRAVRAQQAEREWEMAQFFARKRDYQAAAFYYNVVATKYGETTFGEMARERLQQIGRSPSKPADRFAWLNKVLPSNDGGPQPVEQQETKLR